MQMSELHPPNLLILLNWQFFCLGIVTTPKTYQCHQAAILNLNQEKLEREKKKEFKFERGEWNYGELCSKTKDQH